MSDYVRRLRAALFKYGTHLQGCPRWVSSVAKDKCTCGFHEALGGPCLSCIRYSTSSIKEQLEEYGLAKEEIKAFLAGLEKGDW